MYAAAYIIITLLMIWIFSQDEMGIFMGVMTTTVVQFTIIMMIRVAMEIQLLYGGA